MTYLVVTIEEIAPTGEVIVSAEYVDPIDAAIAIVDQSDRRDLPRLIDAIHAALVPS